MTPPTVILLGGEVTLHSGERIDTREAFEGEKFDPVQRAACFRSEDWWLRTLEVSEVILDDVSHDSKALVWAPRSIYRPRPNGSLKRGNTQLLLKKLRGGFIDQLANLRKPGQASEASASNCRWNWYPDGYVSHSFLDAPYDLFIGGGHNFSNGLAPLCHTRRLLKEPLILLPDTPYIRRKVDAFLKWYEAAERLCADSAAPPNFEAKNSEIDDVESMRPAVVNAEFRITRWIDQGVEQDPAELQAALEFRLSRFDTSVGLFDLARNPVLWSSLLSVEVDSAQPEETISAPAEIAATLKELRAARVTAQEEAEAAEQRVADQIASALASQPHSWAWGRTEVFPKNAYTTFEIPIGEPIKEVLTISGPNDIQLLRVELRNMKRTLRLSVKSAMLSRHVRPLVEDLIRRSSRELGTLMDVETKPAEGVLADFPGYGWIDEPEDRDRIVRLIGSILTEIWPELALLNSELCAAFEDARQEDAKATRLPSESDKLSQ